MAYRRGYWGGGIHICAAKTILKARWGICSTVLLVIGDLLGMALFGQLHDGVLLTKWLEGKFWQDTSPVSVEGIRLRTGGRCRTRNARRPCVGKRADALIERIAAPYNRAQELRLIWHDLQDPNDPS